MPQRNLHQKLRGDYTGNEEYRTLFLVQSKCEKTYVRGAPLGVYMRLFFRITMLFEVISEERY